MGLAAVHRLREHPEQLGGDRLPVLLASQRVGIGGQGGAPLQAPGGERRDVDEPQAPGGLDLLDPGGAGEPLPALLKPRPYLRELAGILEPLREQVLGDVAPLPELAVAPHELDPHGRLLRGVAGEVLAEVALQEVELGVWAELGVVHHPQRDRGSGARELHAVGVEEPRLQEARVVLQGELLRGLVERRPCADREVQTARGGLRTNPLGGLTSPARALPLLLALAAHRAAASTALRFKISLTVVLLIPSFVAIARCDSPSSSASRSTSGA